MRVGLISFNSRARDAIGNHLAEKLAFFLDHGADVRVFLQSTDKLHPALQGHVDKIDEVRQMGPAWDFLSSADLVIVDFAQAYDLLYFLPLLSNGKPRLLLEYHGITPPQFWNGAQRVCLDQGLSQRGLVWCADNALVHSGFTLGELSKATGFPRDRMFQLDFPLDERFYPGPSPSSMRVRLGLAGATVLLYVGRVAPNKGLPVLIEAVARLRDIQPAAHAVIVGDKSDVYGEEECVCRELAHRLGIGEHVHFMGSVSEERLADLYRGADLLVMPSLHEGFCVPVLEAMACGLPVLAARATALPETVGDAGITFIPGDTDDLARQVRRVLDGNSHAAISKKDTTGRVALVSFRFGANIVGGAEASLRKIGQALAHHGQKVEVFTTCTKAESSWTNELPVSTSNDGGMVIHRFPIDTHDRDQHLESVRKIVEANGDVGPEVEKAYLEHSIHSRLLVNALKERINDFDAIIVGPYLFGLTYDITQAFLGKTLLLSCFHQEPMARLKIWPTLYGQVGGILFHSPEERSLAQNELGINHPNSPVIGTYLETQQRPPEIPLPLANRYLVYCGRYSRQKDVPRLIEYAARYHADRPGRFSFAFMGQGEVAIPKFEWARDLGRVNEATKRGVLAGAAALVQLSKQESLSLVALEAWMEGTPVLVDKQCSVLAGQVRRSQGGRALEDYADFADALDDLWDNPHVWVERGRSGQKYVRECYASESAFVDRLLPAIANLRVSLRDQMRQRGLARGNESKRTRWRERFGKMVEQILDSGPRTFHEEVTIVPVHEQTKVKVGTRSMLIPVRVHNRGTHAICAEGPARKVLFCAIGIEGEAKKIPLSGLLLPGKSQTIAARIDVPPQSGEYSMYLWVDHDRGTKKNDQPNGILTVGSVGDGSFTGPFLEAARDALGEVENRRRLPDSYLDVTEGWLARWKLWIKSKLLGNFKRGYVDVLSRQQSQVNRQVLAALQQLTECSATLDHALRVLGERLDRLEERLEDSKKKETLV